MCTAHELKVTTNWNLLTFFSFDVFFYFFFVRHFSHQVEDNTTSPFQSVILVNVMNRLCISSPVLCRRIISKVPTCSSTTITAIPKRSLSKTLILSEESSSPKSNYTVKLTTLTMTTTNNSAEPNSQINTATLEQIREKLRSFDVDCNGQLELELDNESGIATLCINSPARKNAFSGFMMAQFSDILTQLESWKEV